MPVFRRAFFFQGQACISPLWVILGHGKEQPTLPVDGHASIHCGGGRRAFTIAAERDGAAMGLSIPDMLAVIASLTHKEFYKSMTTYHDHRIWQDVYHGRCPNGLMAYIKLTQVAERIVIQFKEK